MASRIFRAAFAVVALVASTTAQVSDGGKTVIVNGISYYAAPEIVSIIDATPEQLKAGANNGAGMDLIPLTVMGDTTTSFTQAVFRSLVDNYTSSDDVYNPGFLQGMSI